MKRLDAYGLWHGGQKELLYRLLLTCGRKSRGTLRAYAYLADKSASWCFLVSLIINGSKLLLMPYHGIFANLRLYLFRQADVKFLFICFALAFALRVTVHILRFDSIWHCLRCRWLCTLFCSFALHKPGAWAVRCDIAAHTPSFGGIFS
jgi:hypothetical protein